MVKKGFIAILFAHSQSETYEQSLSLVKDILKYEGKVIFITDSNLVFENDNLCAITIPSTNAELFTIPCIVPVQLLINTWATKCGIIPGEFTHGAKNNINRINYENCVSKENCNWSRYWRD